MAGQIEARLAAMGISIPEPVAPVAAYVPFVRTGNLVFVSGQVPKDADGMRVGQLTAADHADGAPADGSKLAYAMAAAELCALNLLSQVKVAVGDLDNVTRVVKLNGFVNCDGTFGQQPQVVNGASEFMMKAFGDAGQHARAAVGSSSLPGGCIVEVEGIFEVA